MDRRYAIDDTREINSPALIVFHELLQANLEKMVQIAGRPSRLRPHCKTHKLPQVVALELELGITKHKCATIAEAEMLAEAGAKDIFLAYNLVGPNLQRAVKFVQQYPDISFCVTVDHAGPLRQLNETCGAADCSMEVLLDIDTGQHRTGLPVGPAARELYERIAAAKALTPGGFHVYDGQNHQTDLAERRSAVHADWGSVSEFRDEVVAGGLPVPRIVAGGTGSFPVYAAIDDPTLELSPGTTVFFDTGYRDIFPDLQFVPAALLLTRVVSCPGHNRVTCDLGYKACASDPPAGQRLELPDLPEALQVLQNEEHLVLETPRAAEFAPGDELLAIPRHICPTTALHQQVYVVKNGKLQQRWKVTARDRLLTI